MLSLLKADFLSKAEQKFVYQALQTSRKITTDDPLAAKEAQIVTFWD